MASVASVGIPHHEERTAIAILIDFLDRENLKSLLGMESSKTSGRYLLRLRSDCYIMLKWGEKVLAQIKEVSMDMTGNYKSLVKKICPNADVTIDRFHVMQIVQAELNQARISQKKAAQSLKFKERAKLFDSLKGNQYTLLKAENNLNEKQKKIQTSKRCFTVSRNYALIKRRVLLCI